MDTVAEFVEEGNDFIVFEEGGFGRCWLGEIANEGRGWVASGAVRVEETGLKIEVGSVAILSWTWVKIEVEITDKSTAFFLVIPDAESLDIFMPEDIFALSGSCHL